MGDQPGVTPIKGAVTIKAPPGPPVPWLQEAHQVDPVCVHTNRCLGLGDGQRAEAGIRGHLGLGGTWESQGRNIARFNSRCKSLLCFPEVSSCLRCCQRCFRDLVPSLGSKQAGAPTSLGLHLHVPYRCFVPQNTPTGSTFLDTFSPRELPSIYGPVNSVTHRPEAGGRP